jgi:hypothetical protein
VEIRSQQNELILAKARDQLILKDLVEKQAAYLVVCMRQRMLQIPHTWARRILNLTEVREAREILREMVIGALKELASLPMKVIDPNWLDTLEGNGSPSETVEAGKASGSKSMAKDSGPTLILTQKHTRKVICRLVERAPEPEKVCV